jgi:hypothetical protein
MRAETTNPLCTRNPKTPLKKRAKDVSLSPYFSPQKAKGRTHNQSDETSTTHVERESGAHAHALCHSVSSLTRVDCVTVDPLTAFYSRKYAAFYFSLSQMKPVLIQGLNLFSRPPIEILDSDYCFFTHRNHCSLSLEASYCSDIVE